LIKPVDGVPATLEMIEHAEFDFAHRGPAAAYGLPQVKARAYSSISTPPVTTANTVAPFLVDTV